MVLRAEQRPAITCIFPLGRPRAPHCGRISTAAAQRQVAEGLASKQNAPFSQHPGVDAQLQLLYRRMLDGEADVQVEIDSFIFAELLLQRHSMRDRLLRMEHPDVVDLLRSPVANTLQALTLPDLGSYIREVVFFSGNAPPVLQLQSSQLHGVIYEALPNIKRTKQVRSVEKNRLQGFCPRLCNACINVMMGTLLGLYEGTAKAPVFARRTQIVGELYNALLLSHTEKQQWLASVSNLLRLCFMEYVMWFINSFMPVEKGIITQRPSTTQYNKACTPLCDAFRQQVSETTCSLPALDSLALQHIERCTRMCKFKMQRHVQNSHVQGAPVNVLSKQDVEGAMQLLRLACGFMYSNRHKGRLHLVKNQVHDMRTLFPWASMPLLHTANQMQQQVYVEALPRNIAAMQLRALRKRFWYCDLRAQNARCVRICMMCSMQQKDIQRQKFRHCILSNKLQCTHCQNDSCILLVDLVGYVLYHCASAFFLCTSCGGLCCHDGSEQGWLSCCPRCRPKQERKRKRPRVVCLRCDATAATYVGKMLDAERRCMVAVHLCTKHTLPQRVLQRVREVTQLLDYE